MHTLITGHNYTWLWTNMLNTSLYLMRCKDSMRRIWGNLYTLKRRDVRLRNWCFLNTGLFKDVHDRNNWVRKSHLEGDKIWILACFQFNEVICKIERITQEEFINRKVTSEYSPLLDRTNSLNKRNALKFDEKYSRKGR